MDLAVIIIGSVVAVLLIVALVLTIKSHNRRANGVSDYYQNIQPIPPSDIAKMDVLDDMENVEADFEAQSSRGSKPSDMNELYSYLVKHEGDAITYKDIQSAFGWTNPRITEALHYLMRNNYVSRQAHPDYQRRYWYKIGKEDF